MKNITIKSDSLLLSGDKVFFSLQGEGISIGKPAVFLRLHLCNLKCSFCDTKYTWDRKDKRFYTEPERWSIERTVKEIEKYHCHRLVITGGEPLLQREALIQLIDRLEPDNLPSSWYSSWSFEIETNGTFAPLDKNKIGIRDLQYNVSPKLKNSGNPRKLRYKPKILKQYNEKRYNSVFKFVVIQPDDLIEIRRIVAECDLDKNKIILMPEGTTQEKVAKHGRAVVELCKKEGWQLIPRLQVMLWGDIRKK